MWRYNAPRDHRIPIQLGVFRSASNFPTRDNLDLKVRGCSRRKYRHHTHSVYKNTTGLKSSRDKQIPLSGTVLEKMTVSQLLKKCSIFYGTQTFITVHIHFIQSLMQPYLWVFLSLLLYDMFRPHWAIIRYPTVFITVFTEVRQWPLSSTRWIQSIPSRKISKTRFNVNFPSTTMSPKPSVP
jgi:hypothetical protein